MLPTQNKSCKLNDSFFKIEQVMSLNHENAIISSLETPETYYKPNPHPLPLK
jgi:hypothetical protein